MAAKKNEAPKAPSLPFATSDGAVPGVGPMAGKPNDFTRSPTSDAQRAARGTGRDPAQSRTQRAPEAPEPAAPEKEGYSGAGRVDPSSVPRGGLVPPAVPASGRGNYADGGPTPTRLPFKGLK